MFAGETILITGGTGSFGETILSHLLMTDIAEVRIFSRDEKKQEDLRLKYRDPRVNLIVGDVREAQSISNALIGVDHVFQAAALKQVPSCEFYPLQAIKTNVLGAENVLEAALANNVRRVVVLSTDKAVYPINTMGMTKALMEKLAVSKARDPRAIVNDTRIMVTRYGNVMCSRGSVIPLFISQIKSGQDLTITVPTMTRFLMSLEESVSLVMKAFAEGKGGDVFVQKAPACTVIDLAEALIKIFQAERRIKILGSRHGEKMHETLCSTEEMAKAEDIGGYFRVPPDLRDMNYARYTADLAGDISAVQEYNSSNTHQLEQDEIIKTLLAQPYVVRELAG